MCQRHCVQCVISYILTIQNLQPSCKLQNFKGHISKLKEWSSWQLGESEFIWTGLLQMTLQPVHHTKVPRWRHEDALKSSLLSKPCVRVWDYDCMQVLTPYYYFFFPEKHFSLLSPTPEAAIGQKGYSPNLREGTACVKGGPVIYGVCWG